MEINLKNNEKAFIRPYEEKDFSKIQDLNKEAAVLYFQADCCFFKYLLSSFSTSKFFYC